MMESRFLTIKASNWNADKEIAICIISIIPKEMREIVEMYKMHSQKKEKYIYWEGRIEEYPNICIHCYQLNESGNIYSGQLTEYVLEQEYDYYFCIGTAGAVKAKLYDVVIANQIIYLGKGANTLTGREYDGKAPEISERERNIINTFLVEFSLKDYNFSVVVAPVYSGDNVEKNPQIDELKEGNIFSRHLAAIDMESFGVFESLRFYEAFKDNKRKLFFIIRGISDNADDFKNSIYEDGLSPDERKRLAMKNVLKVLNNFILFLKDCPLEK